MHNGTFFPLCFDCKGNKAIFQLGFNCVYTCQRCQHFCEHSLSYTWMSGGLGLALTLTLLEIQPGNSDLRL